MRAPSITGALVSGFTAAIVLSFPAAAQVSLFIPAIGYYKVNLPSGYSLIISGFVTRKEFQGQATSVAGGASSTINQAGAGWIPGAFNLHYVEILDGLQIGLVLDILGNSATSLTIDANLGPAPGFNLAQNVKYAIRKHSTLDSIFKGGAGGLSPFEDSITLFYDDGSKKTYYYDDTPPGHIVADDLSTIKDNEIVYPGQGMLLNIAGPRQFTFGVSDVSHVKDSPTKIPLYGGKSNPVGLVNPVVAAAPYGTGFDDNEQVPIGSAAYGLIDSGLVEFEDEVCVFGRDLHGNFRRLGCLYYDWTLHTMVDANGYPEPLYVPNGTAILVKPTGNRYYNQPGVTISN